MTVTSPYGIELISDLNIALLHDSNWYTEVKYREMDDIQWGKGKGCKFIRDACYNDSNFPEFFTELGCTFNYEAVGSPSSDPFMDGCLFLAPFPGL